MKFFPDQIAICPADPARAIALLEKLGMTDWVRDHVVASGEVHGFPGRNEADLAFSYTALPGHARELEVLNYTTGPNWMTNNPNQVSHFGMHVTAEQLVEWRAFFAAEDIPVAQEVFTESHSNPFLIDNGRKFNYVIFNTRPILGVDLKFIVRIERA
jgi:hypothetical protein